MRILISSLRDRGLQTNTEIIVREGDEDGRTIAEVVKETGASTLLVGLHQQSFLYRYYYDRFESFGSFFKDFRIPTSYDLV